jgi:hypothetical protein
MKTLLKILVTGILTLGLVSCGPDDPSIVDPVDTLGTPFNSTIIYDQLVIDWTSTGEQNVNMMATGGCQEGQFRLFELENSHLMSNTGKVVRWKQGTFALDNSDGNGISGEYEALGTVVYNNVSIEIDFYLTGGWGDFCNASGQIKGLFTNVPGADVYELKLEGKIYPDLKFGR